MKPRIYITATFLFLSFFIGQLALAQPPNREAELANEYFSDGEFEKALELYQKLHRQDPNFRDYSYRVADCYLELNKKTEALDFVDKLAKKNKNEPIYFALQGLVLDKAGKTPEAETVWNEMILKKIRTDFQYAEVGSFFIKNKQFEFAKKTYLQARIGLKFPNIFANELGFVFQYLGEWGQATLEFLTYMHDTPGMEEYAQTQIFQMIREDNKPAIEKALLANLQTSGGNWKVQEILYEFYIQTENFREALVQGKSIDKLKKERGARIFKLAQTLQNNRRFDLSNDALDYIIKNYRDSQHYLESFQERARNYELKAFETRPLDTLSLRQAVKNYDELFQQFGRQPNFFEAMFNKAKLCMFYLNDLPCAEMELNQIEQANIPPVKKAEAKLLAGDALLMRGDFTKALLKYVEISEAFKEGQVGAMAKFREAKLNYYKGDFESSKTFLNILKDNTTNDIANDAIKLFLLIQDNTGLDSTTTALQKFAKAQLFGYQKLYQKAMPLLDSILYDYPNHPLTDDIYWEKAQIFLNQGEVDKALALYDKILEQHKEDVLADDALFAKAEITQYTFKDVAKAQELYLKLLMEYPGSLYKVEARKRIRELRGDKMEELRN